MGVIDPQADADSRIRRRILSAEKYGYSNNKVKLDAGMWRYHANRMDARRSQFDLGILDAYI